MRNWLKENEKDALRFIGAEVTKARKAARLSQRQLAEVVGTTQTSIRRLEGGETNVSAVLMTRAAKVLRLPLIDLLEQIEPESELVELKFAEYSERIEQTTSAMGLTVNDFWTKRALLQMLGVWPKPTDIETDPEEPSD